MECNIVDTMVNSDPEYLKVKDASARTGLPIAAIRSGCRAGTIPHIILGKTVFLHMPSFRELLSAAMSDGRKI